MRIRGGMLMIAVAGGLLQAAGASGTWRTVKQADELGLPGDEIQFIRPGRSPERVWIGTMSGAAVLEKGVLTPLAGTEGLQVWDILELPDGGYWLGHAGGAVRVQDGKRTDTLEGYTVAAILQHHDMTLAVAKHRDAPHNRLMVEDAQAWRLVTGFEERYVEDLVLDGRGTLWVMLDGDGVVEIPAEGFAHARHHLAGVNVTAVMTDTAGRTWCGLWGGGVMLLQAGEWTRHLGRERSAVLRLIEDGQGRVWAATSSNGLWLYDGGTWRGMLQDEGAISLLEQTSDGRIWISSGASGGLRYLDGGEWKASLETMLPVRCLAELPGGVLLVGGVLDGLHIKGDLEIKGGAHGK